MRKVDISQSCQTVSEAIEQLIGAIKEAVVTELPGLARRYGFKTYRHSDKDRLSRQQDVNARFLSPGSTLLIFPEVGLDREAQQDFRPNFRNLRSKVRRSRRP